MQERIYNRLLVLAEQLHGYIRTEQMLSAGLTNRQIGNLLEEGELEKISNGYFWCKNSLFQKPQDYKAVETCFVNPNAVICADSACYYLGLIPVEPSRLSVATRRSDRRKMELPFPTIRHYISEKTYGEDIVKVDTLFGSYQVYSTERSVCDCIRFRESIEAPVFELILETYRQNQTEKQRERLLAYARAMQIEGQAKREIR